MTDVESAFLKIALNADLAAGHSFDSGEDSGPYFNFTIGTPQPLKLWREIERLLYEDENLGEHLRRASMALCSGENGWDDYLLLYHFDPTVQLDSADAL